MNLAAFALILAAALPQFGASQGTAPASETEVLAVRDDSTDRLTVPVKLSGKGPFHFLIDTGAQNTVIARSLASRLALVSGSSATLVGVAGQQVVPTVEIEEIALGRRTYYGVTAPVLERANLGADGILGLDSLQEQRILLDFRKGLMAVNDGRSLGGDSGFEIVVNARRRSGQLIMTNARIDGIAVDVVVDTGSDTTLGNRALQKAMGRRGAPVYQSALLSVTGQQIPADVSPARKLVIQGLTMNRPTIAYSDSPTFAYLGLNKKPAILLGMREMRAFPRIAIDFRSRKVLFDLPDSGDPAYFGIDTGAAASRIAN